MSLVTKRQGVAISARLMQMVAVDLAFRHEFGEGCTTSRQSRGFVCYVGEVFLPTLKPS